MGASVYHMICVVVAFGPFVEPIQLKANTLAALMELQKSYFGASPSVEAGIGAIGAMQAGSPENEVGMVIGAMQASVCVDKSEFCNKHKALCSNQYIQFYCERTCGKCPTSKSEGSEDCKDKHPQCTAYAKRRFCTGRSNEVSFMNTNCRKTCKFCQSQTLPTNTRACGIATIRSRKGYQGQAIVGGANSIKGYFPWQVAIYHKDKFLCGGSLIGVDHVLSAAHCFAGLSDAVENFLVVLGEYNRGSSEGTEQEVKVSKITVHELYNKYTKQEDVAIVKLAEHARISDHIETICLPTEAEERMPGSKCFLSGWGKKSVSQNYVAILQELEVPVVDHRVCNARNKYSGLAVTAKMMCTGHNNGYTWSSGCHGDSGGPLSCKTKGNIWKVFGVVSWGSSQCNGLDSYTVFSKVNMYLPWIRKHTSG